MNCKLQEHIETKQAEYRINNIARLAQNIAKHDTEGVEHETRLILL